MKIPCPVPGLVAALLLMAAGGHVYADTWNCSNPDIEVGCSDGTCVVTEDYGFTPMSIAFNDSGSLSLCAYSGCWEGEGKVQKTADFLSIVAGDLRYSTDPEPGEMRQHAALLLDLHDNVAVLKLGTYAQPLVCTPLQVQDR